MSHIVAENSLSAIGQTDIDKIKSQTQNVDRTFEPG